MQPSLKSNFKTFSSPLGTSLVAQWLRLCTPNADGLGSAPGQGARSLVPQLRVCVPQLRVCVPQLRPSTAEINFKKCFYPP